MAGVSNFRCCRLSAHLHFHKVLHPHLVRVVDHVLTGLSAQCVLTAWDSVLGLLAIDLLLHSHLACLIYFRGVQKGGVVLFRCTDCFLQVAIPTANWFRVAHSHLTQQQERRVIGGVVPGVVDRQG